jgi:hypothetical protein
MCPVVRHWSASLKVQLQFKPCLACKSRGGDSSCSPSSHGEPDLGTHVLSKSAFPNPVVFGPSTCIDGPVGHVQRGFYGLETRKMGGTPTPDDVGVGLV